jgi:hypothetical protein
MTHFVRVCSVSTSDLGAFASNVRDGHWRGPNPQVGLSKLP